eukprot:12152596-Alexandrium_andersonii.AAC.1
MWKGLRPAARSQGETSLPRARNRLGGSRRPRGVGVPRRGRPELQLKGSPTSPISSVGQGSFALWAHWGPQPPHGSSAHRQ